MDFGIGIASGVDGWKVAQRAEELGFTHAWFYDTQMLCTDVFVSMALAADGPVASGFGADGATNRIAPAAANGLATLGKLAPGRVDFGVGTGFTARNTVELPQWTLDDLREYMRVVQGLLAGATVQWEPKAPRTVRFLNPAGGLRHRQAVPLPRLGVRPAGARALTAEIADRVAGLRGPPSRAQAATSPRWRMAAAQRP